MAMEVLELDTYLKISDLYGGCRENMIDNRYALKQAVELVVNLTGQSAFAPEIDLVNPLWIVYQSSGPTLESMAYFLDGVKAVNTHVLEHCGYTGETALSQYINGGSPTILDDDSSEVISYGWYEMSTAAGFTIDPRLVETPPSNYDRRSIPV